MGWGRGGGDYTNKTHNTEMISLSSSISRHCGLFLFKSNLDYLVWLFIIGFFFFFFFFFFFLITYCASFLIENCLPLLFKLQEFYFP